MDRKSSVQHYTWHWKRNGTCTVMHPGKGQSMWPSQIGPPVRGQDTFRACIHTRMLSWSTFILPLTIFPLWWKQKVTTSSQSENEWPWSSFIFYICIYISYATQQHYFAGDYCEFHNRWMSLLLQVHLQQVALTKLLQKINCSEEKKSLGNNPLLSLC